MVVSAFKACTSRGGDIVFFDHSSKMGGGVGNAPPSLECKDGRHET